MCMVNMDVNYVFFGKEQLYCGGVWVLLSVGNYEEIFNLGIGQLIGLVVVVIWVEVDVVFVCLKEWCDVVFFECVSILQEIVVFLYKCGDEFVMMDVVNCGNLYIEVCGDVVIVVVQMEFFVGFVIEMKGDMIFLGLDWVNMILCQLFSVVVCILVFNYLFMFCGGKVVVFLVVGNVVIIKLQVQVFLFVQCLVEIVYGLMFKGIFNVLLGDLEVGVGLVEYFGVVKVMFIGFVLVGWVVM